MSIKEISKIGTNKTGMMIKILIVSLVLVIVFPIYEVFFAYPAFTRQLVENTKDEAVRAASHLTSMFSLQEMELRKGAVEAGLLKQTEKMMQDFGLMKIKIFSKSGEIIYSTDPQDIGVINTKNYFREIVAKGNVYTKYIKKDQLSAEDQKVYADVVETYVPAMDGDQFLGAFELYYDITNRSRQLRSLLLRSSVLLFTLAACLLVSIVMLLIKEKKAIAEHKQVENEVRSAYEQLEQRVKDRTFELTVINKELQREIEDRRRAEETVRNSEQRFRALVENSLSAIAIIRDEQVVYRNPEHERMFGPLPAAHRFSDFTNVHAEDVEKIRRYYQALLLGEKPDMQADVRIYSYHVSGSETEMKWVFLRANVIDYQGYEAILVNIMDVTRTKELERLVRIDDKMASLGRISAGIAHEIRNPLAGVNMYLASLKKILCDQGVYEAGQLAAAQAVVKKIQSASNKIEEVVRRVMDFSRPNLPKLELAQPNNAIENAMSLVAAVMRKSNISVEKVLDQNLPECYLDTALIEQVLLNLFTNAMEVMKVKNGAKLLEIASLSENGRVVIAVADSGLGVPLELREKIFDPFFTTKTDGSGIGLSLCHRIIKDHGGSLKVSASKWGGARFVIELPVEKRGKPQARFAMTMLSDAQDPEWNDSVLFS